MQCRQQRSYATDQLLDYVQSVTVPAFRVRVMHSERLAQRHPHQPCSEHQAKVCWREYSFSLTHMLPFENQAKVS